MELTEPDPVVVEMQQDSVGTEMRSRSAPPTGQACRAFSSTPNAASGSVIAWPQPPVKQVLLDVRCGPV